MDRKTIVVLFGGLLVVFGMLANALGVAGVTNIGAARLWVVGAWFALVIMVVTLEFFASRSIKVVIACGAITALLSAPIFFGFDRWMVRKKIYQESASGPVLVLTPSPQKPVDIAAQIANPRRYPVDARQEPLYRRIQTKEGSFVECSHPPDHATLNYWRLPLSRPPSYAMTIP